MKGLFSHVGPLWGTTLQARDRALQGESNVFRADAIVTIILATATTEAFINELTECLLIATYDHARAPIPAALVSLGDVLREAEEGKASLQFKYTLVAPLLSGVPYDKGQNPFQDFVTLVKLRNDVMHLKPRDTFKLVDERVVTEPPKHIRALQERGIAWSDPSLSISWYDTLQTKEMAEWACRTAKNIILDVVDRFPAGSLATASMMILSHVRETLTKS